jgi:hypothetical protein
VRKREEEGVRERERVIPGSPKLDEVSASI